MNELFAVVIGWALGIFSQVAVDLFKKPQLAAALMRAIKSEAKETRYLLACTAYQLESLYGDPNKDTLAWAVTKMEEYDGLERRVELAPLRAMLNLEEKEFESLWLQNRAAPDVGQTLKEIPTSFLDATLGRSEELPLNFQKNLYALKNKISMINQHVASAMQWHFMTYNSGISDISLERLLTNKTRAYLHIARQCRFASDLIDRLIEIKEPSVIGYSEQ